MKTGNAPIITSLLDNDWYQFKMADFFFKMDDANTNVTYRLFDRTNNRLADKIDIGYLRDEISNLTSLRLSFFECEYLIKQGISVDTVDFINKKLSMVQFSIGVINGNLHISYSGPIGAAILYETPLMAIINELHSTYVMTNILNDDAKPRMLAEIKGKTREKARIIGDIDIKFAEFGTRRRFSKEHQEWVVGYLNKTVSRTKFIGTSNVLLSKLIDRKPIGTMAHQVPMFYAAKELSDVMTNYSNHLAERRFKHSQKMCIQNWIRLFNEEVFWLTDTYTTDWFLRNINSNISSKLMYRQDSGNPFVIANDIITRCCHYRDYPIKIMFSDSLNLSLIQRLHDEFKDQCDVYFGWGTNLTNDVLIKPLNIVVKLYKVEDSYACKLSDSDGKEMGKDASIYKDIVRP